MAFNYFSPGQVGSGGGGGGGKYTVQYIDTTALDLMALIGAPYSPDGTPVVDGDQVLFPVLSVLTGPTGRGVYMAQVDGLGNLTNWVKQIFGGDPTGDSKAGDEVYIDLGAVNADHTWQCYDTPGALWRDAGTSVSLTVKDEGIVVDGDVSEINFTGGYVEVTQTAPGKVQVDIDPTFTLPFVITDWTLDVPSGLYYLDVPHNLDSFSPTTNVGQGALGFKVEMHQVTVPDANTVRLWIVDGSQFDGWCKVIR